MVRKNKIEKPIEQYAHTDKDRANNPHVGLVTPASDPDTGEKKKYEYDPHLDPQLQWAGKAEHTSFEVPTVSLHVHERIDPKRIMDSVKKEHEGSVQPSLFEQNEKPLREAIDFKKKNMPLGKTYIFTMCDYIIWYGKDSNCTKFHKLFGERYFGSDGDFNYVEEPNGEIKTIASYANSENIPKYSKYFQSMDMRSSGRTESCVFEFEIDGQVFFPSGNKSWKTNLSGMKTLLEKNRLFAPGNTLRYKLFFDDYPVQEISHMWMDTQGATNMKYVVQSPEKPIQRCLIMTTDPGDLVLDITCGSGTSAAVAEQWGRRWITCDTSRVALTLAKQRLMTANFDYYKLAYPNEGIGSGLEYKTVPHITLGAIANNRPPVTETLYDQPYIDNKKTRVTGPFTVEAVPAPYAKSFDDLEQEDQASDTSIARTGETLRQSEWRDELLRTGVRAKGGKMISFSRVEPLAGTKFIQAEAETREGTPQKVLVVFGPEHAPLEQRQVENAWQEARALNPDILLFCAFQFDDEAAKDIDELTPAIAGMQLLNVQMNADLLTDDLRKKRSSNESFWLVGQPDVRVYKMDDGKVQVEVLGFDYYNPKTGNVDSGGKKNIAMWLLDTNYDNRSLFPSQVFSPMSGANDGWSKLAKNLKAEIDMEKIEAFRGTKSLEFEPGKVIAVKIIDDRGIESLRVIGID